MDTKHNKEGIIEQGIISDSSGGDDGDDGDDGAGTIMTFRAVEADVVCACRTVCARVCVLCCSYVYLPLVVL